MQALYTAAMGNAAVASQSASALPELYTEGLDAEQIWLQLDMQLGGALKRARRLLRKAGDSEQLINPAMEVVLDGESSGPAECSDSVWMWEKVLLRQRRRAWSFGDTQVTPDHLLLLHMSASSPNAFPIT